MNIKVSCMVSALSNIRDPRFKGEVIKVPIMPERRELYAIDFDGASAKDKTFPLLTLTAERFCDGDATWLEWVIHL